MHRSGTRHHPRRGRCGAAIPAIRSSRAHPALLIPPVHIEARARPEGPPVHRPLGMLLAAAITVATIGGASAANAAPPADPSAALTKAAAGAHANASAALGGIALPSGTAAHLRTAAAAKSHVLSVDETIPVKVATKRYDLSFTSVGPKTDPTRIRLYSGPHSVQIAVRRLVRIIVHPHGAKAVTLETTTTFRRFVVMLTGLQSNPLLGKQKHFATRSDLVAALAHGLAIDSREVTVEYGAVMRLAQMSLDLSTTLLAGMQYRSQHPSAPDLSAVPTTHTTRGSGAYSGAVTLTGTTDTFSVTATNTTDDSSLTEAFGKTAVTITYTVHGVSSTVSF